MAKLALSPELAAWATKIALEVDPDNAALAPMMLDAYVQGGAKRKQLFESTAEVGGFLAEGMTPLLALSFVALSLIGNELMRLLASGAFGAITSVLVGWKTWLEILKIRALQKGRSKAAGRKEG